MCISNSKRDLLKEKSKKTLLTLWKVVRVSNFIGVWRTTYADERFMIGKNVAESFLLYGEMVPGQFHCLFTRDDARNYKRNMHTVYKFKIIKIHAIREDIVAVGIDDNQFCKCLSVSKMIIESLKHQR